MTNQDAQNYFAQVVEEYVCGDISWLLGLGKDTEGKAGPLLNSVVNGIDILGGILYGFGRGMSEKRSVKFLQFHMGLQPDVAKFIYTAVRCGMAHEGVPKMGVAFFVVLAAPADQPFPLKDANNKVQINVAVFARRFLKAVCEVRKNNLAKLVHVPRPTAQETQHINKGIALVTGKFEQYYRISGNSILPLLQSSGSGSSQSAKQ
jgi:hypothetical protein